MPHLIGFCGQRRSGKSTAGQVFTRAGHTSLAFSDPLKEFCGIITGVGEEVYEDAIKSRLLPDVSPPGISGRVEAWVGEKHALVFDGLLERFDYLEEDIFRFPRKTFGWLFQWVGTDIFRHKIHPDYWVKRTMQRAQTYLLAGYHVAITDVRFHNEAEAIRAMGGQIITIVREREMEADGRNSQHVSEQEWKTIPYDKCIRNEDIGVFRREIRNVLESTPA